MKRRLSSEETFGLREARQPGPDSDGSDAGDFQAVVHDVHARTSVQQTETGYRSFPVPSDAPGADIT